MKKNTEFNSNLLKEFHNKKNQGISLKDYSYGSPKSVWWKCKKGHEWKARIAHRSAGRGCPYCAGQLADSKNNLKVLYPNLMKEWSKKN